MLESTCRVLEIHMLAAPESRSQAEVGGTAPEAADAPRAGQPAALLGGPV